MTSRAPALVLNPLVDDNFAAEAEGLVSDDGVDPVDLETALRKHFPNAVVRPRALSGEPDRIWYVYREGHWVPPYALTRASGSR